MYQNDINYSIAGFSIVQEIANGIISAIGLLLEKAREEGEKIAAKKAGKREMQNQLQRHMVDNLPIDLKFTHRVPRV